MGRSARGENSALVTAQNMLHHAPPRKLVTVKKQPIGKERHPHYRGGTFP